MAVELSVVGRLLPLGGVYESRLDHRSFESAIFDFLQDDVGLRSLGVLAFYRFALALGEGCLELSHLEGRGPGVAPR